VAQNKKKSPAKKLSPDESLRAQLVELLKGGNAHVGFLARGSIHIGFPDGCVREYSAPAVIAVEPGHDGWVVGNEPAIVIEFDFEGDTANRVGMADGHRH